MYDNRFLPRLFRGDFRKEELLFLVCVFSDDLKKHTPKTITLFCGNRHEKVLEEIYCRTSKYPNSFFPDTTKYWNNIGFDGIDYISLFKKKLFSLILPEKKSFT